MKHLLLISFATICFFAFGNCKNLIIEKPTDDKETRVIGGAIAKAGEFPHMCGLVQWKPPFKFRLCGASLISEKHILTAAHCVYNSEHVITITCGINHLMSPPVVMQQTDKYIAHPLFDPSNLNHDIGLLTLPHAVTFNTNLKPIRLPTLKQAEITFTGETVTVSGFGDSYVGETFSARADGRDEPQVLRHKTVKIVPNADCAVIYGAHVVINSTVCATQGTCFNDGGSPMYIQEGDEITQIAVASFVHSQGCGTPHPSGFVRTASYLQWINAITGIPIRSS